MSEPSIAEHVEAPGDSEPLVQMIARHLREGISDGRLAPGAPIRQEAVAKEFGTSRLPVREALRLLETEGLVTIRTHSGARVAFLDFDECLEIYKIRERIEPLALGESVGNLSDEQVQAVRAAATHMEDLVDDRPAWLDADRQFHLACYAGAPLPRLTRTIVAYWNTTQQYRRVLLTTFTDADFAAIHSEHRLLTDLLATGNRPVGEELMRWHIERSRRRLSEHRELFDR
jgi:DNA-binding GntR family transcriptional regulator